MTIEVVTKEVAISNEADNLSGTEQNIEDFITDTNIGIYHIMVGGKYYFRQM
jgi:hypothetical protein